MKKMISILHLTVLFLLQILAGTVHAQVAQQWAQRFTSAGYVTDRFYDMFVDAQGNVYVTGSQKGTGIESEAVTIKYNSQGIQQWIQNYHAPANNGALGYAIHVDADGYVYVTGQNALHSGGSNQMLVIKYSPSGTQLWSYRFQYINNTYCAGYDVISDATGNVYVTGQFGSYGFLYLAKFSPNGALIGQTNYTSAAAGGRKIKLDGAGKIIVGGWSFSGLTQFDSTQVIALKFEQNLDFVWATRWGGSIVEDAWIDMAIDNNSNIILTGTRKSDYATVKINPAGAIQWAKMYDTPAGSGHCRGVVTDNTGNIYVTGETYVIGYPTYSDFFTIKYDANGNEQWIRTLKPTLPQDGYSAYDIAIDNSANIYITGSTYGASDIITVKYNTAGTLQWVKTYNGRVNNYGFGEAVGVDLNGNIYVAGSSFDNTTGLDFVTLKYAPVPVFLSEFRKNVAKAILDNQTVSDTISVDYTSAIDYRVLDVNVKIDTVLHPNVSDLEFTLVHNGITDTLIYQVGGTGDNFIGTILNDSAATSIASGTAPFTGSFRPTRPLTQFNNTNVNGNWILRVFDRAPGNTGTLRAWSLSFVVSSTSTDVRTSSNAIPSDFVLQQNYPNPFNPSTAIKYQIPAAGIVSLKVYDVLGKEVATLVNEEKPAGNYEVNFNASSLSSGVYFYKLQSGNFVETMKMILIK